MYVMWSVSDDSDDLCEQLFVCLCAFVCACVWMCVCMCGCVHCSDVSCTNFVNNEGNKVPTVLKLPNIHS